MRVLVTGGAGFIGSHLVDALVQGGHEVTVLDSLHPAAHPQGRPDHLNPAARYVWGDVRHRGEVAEALEGVQAVCHLASLIEVAESVADPGRYVDANVRGTAVLCDVAIREGVQVERIVLASSAAVYGEGASRCGSCGPVRPKPRGERQLQRGEWEPSCPHCAGPVKPLPTSEDTELDPASPYGLTKLAQERIVAAAAEARGLPAVVLRYANVYGPRQRSGAYAGAVTAFLRRLRTGDPPLVHEDGHQTRDFLHVRDAVRATLAALEAPVRGTLVANVGTGRATTVLELAETLGSLVGRPWEPRVEGTHRAGDLRHLVFDVERARQGLGFEATVGLREGLKELLEGG